MSSSSSPTEKEKIPEEVIQNPSESPTSSEVKQKSEETSEPPKGKLC